MKKFDFSTFKFSCSDIHSLLILGKGLKPLKREYSRYNSLMKSDKEKDEDDLKFLREFDERIAVLNDPPLSKTTISVLINQYGRLVYNKKIAAIGDPMSFLKKGTDMEAEAVELLSKIDRTKYELNIDNIENNFLVGRCDILRRDKDKVIDTKISWNTNAFLKSRTTPITAKYWFQMQGYMELYGVNSAEVVFLLLNTPPELIEREKLKIINKFMIGQIDREKYEIDMENIESAFTYASIPLKQRHFRYKMTREPQIFEKVYKKVEKARLWLREFQEEMKNNVFVVSSDKFLEAEKNNTEPDPAESLSSDEG